MMKLETGNSECGIPHETLVELAVTTGTPVKAGVGGGRKFQITRVGVRFVGRMTWEQYLDALRAWKMIRETWDYGLADLLAYGRAEFGDERMTEALVQMEFELLDTTRAYAIGQTLLDLRCEVGMTSEHYYVLGAAFPGIEGAVSRGRWAALAEKHGLSALELRKSIEAGMIVRQENVNDESGRGAGIANMQGLKFWFERWEKQAGGRDAIVHWPVERKKLWLDEMKPLIELAKELEETLENEEGSLQC